MKIAAIRKLLLEYKSCEILTGQMGSQWIGGGGHWVTRVEDGLKITKDSIKGLFDLSQEQVEKIKIEEIPLEQHPIFPVQRRDMNQLTPCPLTLENYGGLEILTFQGACYMVERRYLRAFSVAKDDYKQYMLGWDQCGGPVIMLFDGMIPAGIVRPIPAEECQGILVQMGTLSSLYGGGSGSPEDGGTRKLEAETGIQVNIDDFRVEGDGKEDGKEE